MSRVDEARALLSKMRYYHLHTLPPIDEVTGCPIGFSRAESALLALVAGLEERVNDIKAERDEYVESAIRTEIAEGKVAALEAERDALWDRLFATNVCIVQADVAADLSVTLTLNREALASREPTGEPPASTEEEKP